MCRWNPSEKGSVTLRQLQTALRHYGYSMPAVDGTSTQIRYRPKQKRDDHHKLSAAWEAVNEMFKQDLRA